MIIAVIYATFAVAKRKPEKNSGLYGIQAFFCNWKSCVYNCDDHPSLILHSAVHIYDFHIFKMVISLLKNDITYNRSRVNSKFCNLCTVVNLSGKVLRETAC